MIVLPRERLEAWKRLLHCLTFFLVGRGNEELIIQNVALPPLAIQLKHYPGVFF